MKMLGLTAVPAPMQQPAPPAASAPPRVQVTPKSQNFQTACNVPTHVATPGPPVDVILQQIMNLSDQDRLALTVKIQSAGL